MFHKEKAIVEILSKVFLYSKGTILDHNACCYLIDGLYISDNWKKILTKITNSVRLSDWILTFYLKW